MGVECARREHKSDTELSIVSRRNALEDSPLASTEAGEALVYGATEHRGVARVAPAVFSSLSAVNTNRNSGRAVTLISRLSLLCTCSKNWQVFSGLISSPAPDCKPRRL